MITNSIKLSPFKYTTLQTIIRSFSSQIIKTNNDSNKSEDKHLDKTEEDSEKSVSEKQKQIENIVKSEYMDKVWELNQNYSHKLEYNINTDPYYEAHKEWKEWELGISTKGRQTSFKEEYKKWVSYREENQQRYVARRHAKLGLNQRFNTFKTLTHSVQ